MKSLILESFILEEFNFENEKHLTLEKNLIESEDSELISRDINNFILINKELNEKDHITNTYVIDYQNELVGLLFVNYHPEIERNKQVLEEEIEIGLGLLPLCRGKHLGPKIEEELCNKLLEIYPRFNSIVGRIDNNNVKSIRAAQNAGFIHIKDDEYHFNRKR